MLRSSLIALGLLMCSTAPASAQLQLNDFFIDLQDGKTPGELYAANRGDETLYLQVTVEEVLNPGQPNEQSREISNPREAGVLVSPQRLIAEPGEEKRIRIVALEPTAKDRFFKLTVTPVIGDLETEEAIGVKVLIAYAAWVFQRPEGAKPAVTAEQTGNILTLHNTGGTHAEITGMRQCAPSGDCEKLAKTRVMAGQNKRIELASSDPVEAKVLFDGASSPLIIR